MAGNRRGIDNPYGRKAEGGVRKGAKKKPLEVGHFTPEEEELEMEGGIELKKSFD